MTCPTPSLAFTQFSTVSAEKSDRDPHTLLCCLFLSFHGSFTHFPFHPFSSIFSFGPHIFPPCCLMSPLVMWSAHSSACVASFPAFLHHPSSPCLFLPSFSPPNSFLDSISYHSGIQWMDYCCISCYSSSVLLLVISSSLLHISAVSSLDFHQLSCSFLLHSVFLSLHSYVFLALLTISLPSSLLPSPFFGPLPPQAGSPPPSDLSTRQQSPPPASPLSRSNLCSLLYSAPSGMAVVSGKFSASS